MALVEPRTQHSPDQDPLEGLWPRELPLAQLRQLLGPEADATLQAVLTRTVTQPLWGLLDRGGKRWRPLISKSVYLSCGGLEPGPEAAFQVVELLHNGSLVVDDIQDGAVDRRGGSPVHLQTGLPVALNAANAAYFRALQGLRHVLPDALRLRALDMLSEELFIAHLGQALDLSLGAALKDGRLLTVEHYRALARAKTGALVRMAARMGAIAAGAPPEREAAMGRWAENVGLAYQVKDDLEDVEEGLQDIEAGRFTLPLVLLLEQAQNGTAEWLRALMGTPALAASDREKVRRMLESTGVLNRVRDEARASCAAARQVLEMLPVSESRAFLDNLTVKLSGA